MKKPLKIVLVILGLVILANVAIFATGDVHVKSSSSGLLTTNDHYTRYNSFFKFHFPDFFYGETMEDEYEEYLKSAEAALNTVINIDPQAYNTDLRMASELVFPIDNYIYYYHEDDFECFYRLDTETNDIEAFPFTEFALYGEYSVETATKHGMSNFVVEAPIVAEGLITQFNMTDTINSIAGVFYEVDIFYSNGKIFFEKNDKLYEFVVETGRLRTIGSIDDALSIEYIYAS